jgi:hypothetical protein
MVPSFTFSFGEICASKCAATKAGSINLFALFPYWSALYWIALISPLVFLPR